MLKSGLPVARKAALIIPVLSVPDYPPHSRSLWCASIAVVAWYFVSSGTKYMPTSPSLPRRGFAPLRLSPFVRLSRPGRPTAAALYGADRLRLEPAMGFADTDLHQILADDQLAGKVLLGQPQARHRRVGRSDVT